MKAQQGREPTVPWRPLVLVALAVVYFIAGKAGLAFAGVNNSASAVWPPTGIALAAYLLLGYRVWPAILAGAFLVNVTTTGAVAASLGIALGNAAEGLAGAWLVNTYARGPRCFERARDVFKFAGSAALATVISATVGTTTLALAGLAAQQQLGMIWLTWWLGDASGALLVTPLIVLWARGREVPMAAGELMEVAFSFVVILAVGVACFAVPALGRYGLAFLCLPPLAWLAFRAAPREVATAVAALAAIAVFTTESGLGPFALAGRHESLLVLQAFMATLALTMLPIAALVGEIAQAIEARERAVLDERRARADAEAASRAKDEFLAMLSHELRNPLQAIGNSTHMLERHGREPGSERSVEIIRRQTENLTRLVNDLLDVARAAAGKIVIIRQSVNLERSLRNCLDQLAARLAEHNVEVSTEPAWVHADPTRVEQMILNMLANAAKFTPKGGTIRAFVVRDGANAVVRIEDEGVGIAPELLPRIFDAFTQGRQKSPDRREGGLGIGLALVRELARLHGGRVEAASEGPGKGSRFVLSLPLGRMQSVPNALPADGAAPSPRRVLVIEGESTPGGSVRAMLEGEGYEVFHAQDARAGVQAALQVRPDVVVVDLGHRGGDGEEIARNLRARAAEIGVPFRVVGITHYANLRETSATEAIYDEELVRPFDVAVLKRALQPDALAG